MNSLKRVDTIHLLVIALFIFLVVGLSFGMIGPETSTCRHNESIEMIEDLKERAKGLNPEDIKAMMQKMKKLTGEDFPEDLRKMLIQISEKHKNKK